MKPQDMVGTLKYQNYEITHDAEHDEERAIDMCVYGREYNPRQATDRKVAPDEPTLPDTK